MENNPLDKKTKRLVEGLVLGIVVGTGLGAGYGYIEYRNYHTITNLSLEDVNQDGTKDFVGILCFRREMVPTFTDGRAVSNWISFHFNRKVYLIWESSN